MLSTLRHLPHCLSNTQILDITIRTIINHLPPPPPSSSPPSPPLPRAAPSPPYYTHTPPSTCPLVPRKNHQPPRVSTLRQDVASVSNEAALRRRCRADNSRRHLFLTKPLINVDVAAVPLTVAAMEERQNSIVKEIMGKIVSAQSARNYSYQNIAFALFC